MNQNEVKKPAMEKEIGLPGIFGIEALELLTKKLSQATGFSFTVIDYRGNPLTDGIICNRFCEYHKDKRECAECQLTAAFAAAKSAIKCCPFLFACPLGLYSIAVPIIVNDQYLGALVGGRVRCPDEGEGDGDRDLANGPDMTSGSGGSGPGSPEASPYTQEEEYQALPLFAKEKMKAIGDLMFFMLREIGEKETLGLKLSTASSQEAVIEDLRRWNAKLREELKKSELKHLRSHIHPQFLLNIFETVGNYAILEDARKTEELIVDYASIIRYYLDDSEEFTTIEAEFAQIGKYLSIFRAQYESKFQYHIKLSDDVKKVRFPVLILFPLLGFVINYGSFTASKAVLFIDVEYKGDQCLVNMQLENHTNPPESPNRVPGNIMDEELIQSQLADTRKRLNYVYGDKYELEMKPNMITLRFPVTISTPLM